LGYHVLDKPIHIDQGNNQYWDIYIADAYI